MLLQDKKKAIQQDEYFKQVPTRYLTQLPTLRAFKIMDALTLFYGWSLLASDVLEVTRSLYNDLPENQTDKSNVENLQIATEEIHQNNPTINRHNQLILHIFFEYHKSC